MGHDDPVEGHSGHLTFLYDELKVFGNSFGATIRKTPRGHISDPPIRGKNYQQSYLQTKKMTKKTNQINNIER